MRHRVTRSPCSGQPRSLEALSRRFPAAPRRSASAPGGVRSHRWKDDHRDGRRPSRTSHRRTTTFATRSCVTAEPSKHRAWSSTRGRCLRYRDDTRSTTAPAAYRMSSRLVRAKPIDNKSLPQNAGFVSVTGVVHQQTSLGARDVLELCAPLSASHVGAAHWGARCGRALLGLSPALRRSPAIRALTNPRSLRPRDAGRSSHAAPRRTRE